VIIALLTLGAASAAEAGELGGLLLAQSSAITDLRGPGFYLNLFKFVPVLLLFLLWTRTTYWIDEDCKELANLRFETWNSLSLGTGLLGFVLVWLIPVYFVGLLLLLLLYFGPLFYYIAQRNATVPDDRKVLTAYHLGEVANGLMNKVGMKGLFNRSDDGIDRTGPPIIFLGKSQGKIDHDRVAKAEESQFYMSAKELVYDAVLRRATDIHLEPTEEQLAVRYRIDGILQRANVPPTINRFAAAIISRLKIMANLNIAEKPARRMAASPSDTRASGRGGTSISASASSPCSSARAWSCVCSASRRS